MPVLRYPSKISKSYLLKLSLPIFLSNITIPFVGIVDTSLMGHLESEKYLAATSIAATVITLVFWSFGFLRMGTVGIVSQSLGRGDYQDIVRTVIRNILIAIFISIFIIILKVPILFIILEYFKPSSETFELIKAYISIRIYSSPAELSMYVIVGFYLGIQKTNISSFTVILFSILNIFFSIYFVKNLGLKIEGVAYGTLISAYLTIMILIPYTYFFIKKYFKIIPRFKRIFNLNKILKLFYINFDIFIRTLLLTFAFLWLTFQSSKLGEEYLAANTILLQFLTLAAFFLDSYAFSTEGVIGYSIGRRSEKSFFQVVKNSFELSFITAILISIIYVIFFKELVGLLTDIDIVKYITFGFVFWIVFLPPIASFCYQFDGVFIGAAQTKEMRNAMIISVATFIFISIYLQKYFGNHGLWLSMILFMIMRSLTLMYFFKNILKKFK